MLVDLLTFVTPVAHASVDTFIQKAITYVFNPVIYFMVVVAVVYFIYGIFEYIKDGDNSESRVKGQQHMLWSVIGLFIMIGVFFIMKVLLGSVGIDESQINPQNPTEINITDG